MVLYCSTVHETGQEGDGSGGQNSEEHRVVRKAPPPVKYNNVSDGRVPRGQEAISPVRTGQGVTERSRKLIVHENLRESWWGLRAVPVGSGGRGIVRESVRRTGEH